MQTNILLVSLLCKFALTNARNVILVSDDDFESRIADHDLVLVNFYSSKQCPECEMLEADFETSATALQHYDPPVVLAAIDCSSNGRKTCKKHDIYSYPTLKIFKYGIKAFDYEGPRDADGMIKHVKTKVTPLSKELKSAEELGSFLDNLEYSVVGFFALKDSVIFERYEMFASTLSSSFRFAHTFNEEVLEQYSYNNTFLIFRPAWMQTKFEADRIEYNGKYIPHVMRDWIKTNIFGLVGYRTRRNAVHFNNPLIVVYYNIDGVKNAKQSSYWRNRVMKVANKFSDARSEVRFAVSNAADFQSELSEFGLSVGSGEKHAVIGRDLDNRAYVMSSQFTIDDLERFTSQLLSGELTPAVKVALGDRLTTDGDTQRDSENKVAHDNTEL